ncbi:unnamed protein product, partial [Brassica oleracea]
LAFHGKLESYGSDHKVLLATSINPKIAHQKIDKTKRKRLWRILDCKKLSV